MKIFGEIFYFSSVKILLLFAHETDYGSFDPVGKGKHRGKKLIQKHSGKGHQMIIFHLKSSFITNVSHSFITPHASPPSPFNTIQTFTPCHPTPQTLFPTTTRHHQAYPCQKLLPFTSPTTLASRRPDIFQILFYFVEFKHSLYSLSSSSLFLSTVKFFYFQYG